MAVVLAVGCADRSEGPRFVGRSECVDCHEEESRRWEGSHHDLAMQVASDSSVIGDFADATFTRGAGTSTFFRRDGEFWVRTDGPGGIPGEYRIAYTFGVTPLQQYLIEFPGGRLQALGIAWDARPQSEGGQRWFHVYGDEPIEPGDVLHWTGANQTWNYMCAECHSTDLRKNYDPEKEAYETTWSEIDVSCEACHGPGSDHVRWAERGASAEVPGYGLVVGLSERGAGWVFAPDSAIARRTTPRSSNAQLDTCARCHSRRGVIASEYVYGRPLLDTHRPRTLETDLYFPDGQILDEVYVYGSFLQSRMDAAGVTCSDCHDPHSLTLRADGNALCGRCHLPAVYDEAAHHFHPADSEGARCVECHMPARTYMEVDDRRDHSFRVPRPDLSEPLGTPEPCTGCHTERSPGWAAAAIAAHYGPERRAERIRIAHYGQVLAAGRLGFPNADGALAAVLADREQPGIVRATAATLLGSYGTPVAVEAAAAALDDADPLVRMTAVRALEALEPEQRTPLAFHLLNDEVKAVRMAAAQALATAPVERMTTAQRVELARGIDEYIDAQLTNAERPESHMNIGVIQGLRGQLDAAEAAYREALRIAPWFVPAYVNLADVQRRRGNDDEAAALLREALQIEPEEATVQHALGLALIRQRRIPEAIEWLASAARLQPLNAQFAYVYGVAMNSAGQPDEAIRALEEALSRSPYDLTILLTLATFERDRGRLDSAIEYARRATELWPSHRPARQLLSELEAGRD